VGKNTWNCKIKNFVTTLFFFKDIKFLDTCGKEAHFSLRNQRLLISMKDKVSIVLCDGYFWTAVGPFPRIAFMQILQAFAVE
jgi:hypothetical protein